jgi:hypothetical protein
MCCLMGAVFLAFFLTAAAPSGFSQLRNNSEYWKDRINTEQAYLVLRNISSR